MSVVHQSLSPTAYETDYLAWLETTIDHLRDRRYEQVDWANLIEELEDMGRSERRRLESNTIIILLHLLKWQYQPQARTGSWEASIIEHRRQVREALQTSPSLKSFLHDILAKCYFEAVKQARAETQLPLVTFPEACPYTIANLLDDNFLPN
ncbi:DUF29 domain-containing protein [Trichothermofontia sp.]